MSIYASFIISISQNGDSVDYFFISLFSVALFLGFYCHFCFILKMIFLLLLLLLPTLILDLLVPSLLSFLFITTTPHHEFLAQSLLMNICTYSAPLHLLYTTAAEAQHLC
jgi:hypothetical protein